MGSEISVQRGKIRIDSVLQGLNQGLDCFKSSLMNNLPPVVFHQIHGENIRLSKDCAVASRVEGFCKGITFSNRPICVNERVFIKFLEISTSWSGTIRIGFTANDPMTYRSGLPRYACPDLIKKPGNWAKALGESYVKKDSVLFFYVDENGDFRYGADDVESGIFFGGLNTSSHLWAVVDVYGNTTSIEIIDPRMLGNNADENEESDSDMRSILRHFGSSRPIPFGAYGDMNILPLSFHYLHGKNITLERNGCLAKRKQNTHSSGYVFTQRPLRLDEKVIVEIFEVDMEYDGNLVFGVTSCDPANLTSEELPDNSDDLFDRSEYWVLEQDPVPCNPGDIVICSINVEGQLLFSKDGKEPSVILYIDNTLPLWLFFDLFGCISKINLIGSTDFIPPFRVNGKTTGMHSEPLTVSMPPIKNLPKLSTGVDGACAGPPEDNNECVICYENSINCALYQCGHMCMCYNCAMVLFKNGPDALCPVCRKVIKDVIKTFR